MNSSSCTQRGASLIEVLVALLIFTVGLLGLAAMQLSSLQSTADSGQRSQSVWLMQDFIERMRVNPDSTPTDYFDALEAQSQNCAALPVRMCADYYNPSTAAKVNASECNTAQMAAFDAWEAQCSYAAIANFNTIDARFNSRDFITPPGAGSLVDPNVNGNALVLSLNWQNRSNLTANNQAIATDGATTELRIER
ncbi:type IV pilus modification protein PilV [Ectopseudomonas mendocina]|uniref:Type IV pilus modification protein PilV n=1 Tax=Ectopseudomonas mendocina TaxID=300 RepID=A0ABD7RUD9_ECTME|nr:type IV pilus modification protein PilV [Pseudomonas mendocina]TRO15275.1 type IV pilus modification protein PilV [Pseudomonas mendocina]TRO18066.1 type IV pilus modification protein PilV [Pseudomonas mendocina]